MDFLKGEWRKLAIVNYVIDQELLKDFIPQKTELDIWNGCCYVSLVGFMFEDTRLLGVKVPFHTNFEEVNLRFYVRYKDKREWKRGVVFIKELVPKPALSFVANAFYREHYQTVEMDHLWHLKDGIINVAYDWKYNGKPQSFEVSASNVLTDIQVGSKAEFITEHFWGYTKVGRGKTYEYGVEHPRWQVYPVLDYKMDVDFGLVYGNNFGFLNDKVPDSVMLAEGSEIRVGFRKTL